MSTEVAEVLKRSKARIEDPKHWIKHKTQAEVDGEMCYCALGALRPELVPTADGEFEWTGQSYLLMHKAQWALRDQLPGFNSSVPRFNDHYSTKHADVMDLYDRAIAAEEAN